MAYQEIGLRVILLGVGEFRRSVGIIRSDLTGLERDLRGLNSTTAAVSQKISALGSTMVSTGRALTLGLTLPIVGLGTALFGAGIRFEDSFAGVAKTVEGVSTGIYDVIRLSPGLSNLVRDFQANINAMGSSAQSIDFEQAMRMWVASLDTSQKAAIFASDSFGELTEDGLKARDAIRDLALEIPISADELSRVATIAGELGIPLGEDAEILTEFTRIAALMGVATNMSAEDAANAFGRFGNIFQVAKEDMAEWSLSFGSTLVALGNTTAGTESEISSMALRVAAAGRVAGLSEQEILAMSATMVELGIKAERGGTAFSRVLQEMQFAIADGGDQLQEFADIAGVTTDQFSTIFEQDPTAAVGLLTAGFAKARKEGEVTQDTLDRMGITGVRAIEVMTLLGLSTETFGTNLDTANSAWNEQIALEEEAAKRFKTIASQIQLTKNAFKDLGITIFDLYRDDIENLVTGIGNLVTKFKELDPETQKTIVTVAALAAALGPVMILLGTFLLTAAPVISLLGGLVTGFGAFGIAARLAVPALALVIPGVGQVAGGFGILLQMLPPLAGLITKLPIGALAVPLGLVGAALAVIGGILAAYLTNFMGFKDWIDGIGEAIRGGNFEQAFDILTEGISNLLDTIGEGISIGADWVNEKILNPLVEAVGGIDLGAVLAGLGKFGISILDAIASGVSDLGTWFYNKIIIPISNAISEIDVGEALASAANIGVSILSAIAGGIVDVAGWVYDNVIVKIGTAISNISDEDVRNAAFNAGKILHDLFFAIAEAEIDVATWVLDNIIMPIADFLATTDWSTTFVNAAKTLLGGLWSALKFEWKLVFGAGETLVNDLIIPLVDKLLNVDYIALFQTVGSTMIEAVKQALLLAVDIWIGVPTWLIDNVIMPFINGLVGNESTDQITLNASKLTDAIKDGIKTWFSNPGAVLQWILDNVIMKITDQFISTVPLILEEAKKIGAAILDGIKQGVLEAWESLETFFEEQFAKLPDWVKGPLNISSPSKVFMEIGGNIMEGLKLGMAEGMVPVLNDMNSHMGALLANAQETGISGGLGNIATTNISNVSSRNTRIFNPVYNTAPSRDTVDATRSLYREWNYQT